MIEAVIFDMDGVLIDSEPMWREAEPLVLRKLGVPLTSEMCLETTGLRIDEAVAFWHRRYPWDLREHPIHEVGEIIVDKVIDLVRERGQALPGVGEVLGFLGREPVKLAVASSSPARLIAAVLERLEIRSLFAVVHSAENEPFGKPHPAVFISTANMLGVEPVRCLVLEDSLNGVLAAKAARMACVAVPEAHNRDDPRYCIADRIIPGLRHFDEALWNQLRGTAAG